ncbi:MAG: hypothetical protein V3T78_08970, partial [Dehalococcoidia bacterium]
GTVDETVVTGDSAGARSVVSPENLAGSPAFLAHFQSYWYSRSNLGHLTSRSGLGVRFIPTDDQIGALREMAGITQGPANAFLVQALYSSGDPSFVRPYDGNENDFANFRWDQSKMDRTVTPQAMGYAMIKEVIWAKSFATDVEGPSPLNHFRALTLSTEAAAQARFAAKHLISGDGLLVHGWKDDQITDSSTQLQDQMVMLWALSELSDYATGKYGWYADPLSHEEAMGMADALVAAVVNYVEARPESLAGLPSRDAGVALVALSSYINYAPEGASRKVALESLVPKLAGLLINRMDQQGRVSEPGDYSQVANQAASVQGLVYAFKVTGKEPYREAALRSWGNMESLWDSAAGLYATSPEGASYTYTIRDVGDVSGAINSLLNGLGMNVADRFADFFENAVNRSGLLIAEASTTGGDGDGDSIPSPQSAGGPYGKAPVFATEAVYDVASGRWQVTNDRLTTADAMSAASQMFWMSVWGTQPATPGYGIPGN